MRLIDADAMKADLLTVDPLYEEMIQWCITVLDAQPTIERKTGKWIDEHDMTCSVCGFECDDPYYLGDANYCPNCGADMRT